MKYIKGDHVEIKEVKFAGNTFYQVGTDEWNITVGLGGLVELMNKSKELVDKHMESLED